MSSVAEVTGNVLALAPSNNRAAHVAEGVRVAASSSQRAAVATAGAPRPPAQAPDAISAEAKAMKRSASRSKMCPSTLVEMKATMVKPETTVASYLRAAAAPRAAARIRIG